jgi:aryl-alcohol dehydrogenase-like predicted oxidoreductase
MSQSRPLGRSGIETPSLILGCNVFGWTVDESTSHEILDAFVAGGGKVIDTADIYGPPNHNGVLQLDHVENRNAFKGRESERIIGSWIRKRGRHDDVFISTKAGMMSRADGVSPLAPASIRAAVDGSLRTLGLERLDLFFAHIDDPETPLEETLGTLDELVKAGKIGAIAAANYSTARLSEALNISRSKGLVRFEAYQGMFSLVERGGYEGDLQELLLTQEVAFTPYLGLANGFLTGKYRTLQDIAETHPRAPLIKAYLNDQGLAVLGALDAIAADLGATVAQVALAWVAAQPGVPAPLASATSVKQLNELLGTMQLTLDREQLASLDAASRSSGGVSSCGG